MDLVDAIPVRFLAYQHFTGKISCVCQPVDEWQTSKSFVSTILAKV